MKTLRVYRCLCDETRLRILNLLLEGPLCVCHLAGILGVEQPKISRHLKALKETRSVETERCFNWTICRIAERPGPVLEANLKCLQDLRAEEPVFSRDLEMRACTIKKITMECCDDLPARIREVCQEASAPNPSPL
ncbi:MAG: winged helix-turn-helix transcriptional regulator [Opitutales bacterium]|nr:winged helix-turn-helix transcriptional regulator [Opitutales bacterium]